MERNDGYHHCPHFHDHALLITREEIDQVVRSTVKETLLSMGVDTKDPIEMQKDFLALRDWRTASNSIRSKGIMTIIGILSAGLLGALWIGVKSVIGKP